MTVIMALSYSSRWEITNAMKLVAQKVKDGTLAVEEICENTVTEHLNTHFMPDPDLLIRTGGDLRISNFLLWQIAYSELYFSHKFWPDFSQDDFCEAIIEFQNRERRFGKTSEHVSKH